MALGKINKISFALEDYIHLIIGAKKVGKTTLVADIVKELYGLDKLLCISVGSEDGHMIVDNMPHETPQTWKEFVAIVDELVLHPEENPFKFVSIDTIDEMVNLATKEVFRLHQIEKKEVCNSLNSAFGGLRMLSPLYW